jgi:hypothetical protein
LLRKNPRDQAALNNLHQAYETNQKLNLLHDDRMLLDGFVSRLGTAIEFLSNLQGTSIDGFGIERPRTLFSYMFNLANDLGDFRVYTPAQNRAQSWKVTGCGVRCGNLEYLLGQVEKPGEETWLLVPRMTFPDRDVLSLKIEGSARGPLVDPKGDVSARRFQVLISEAHVAGTAPIADQWVDVTEQLRNFPGGKYAAQFRSFQIELDLSAYRGKTVSIALKLAARPSEASNEKPETQWQINKIAINGKGELELVNSTTR